MIVSPPSTLHGIVWYPSVTRLKLLPSRAADSSCSLIPQRTNAGGSSSCRPLLMSDGSTHRIEHVTDGLEYNLRVIELDVLPGHVIIENLARIRR